MEILDICDELGNPTGKTVERKIAHQQGILHRTEIGRASCREECRSRWSPYH